jgi:hypothetical protein
VLNPDIANQYSVLNKFLSDSLYGFTFQPFSRYTHITSNGGSSALSDSFLHLTTGATGPTVGGSIMFDSFQRNILSIPNYNSQFIQWTPRVKFRQTLQIYAIAGDGNVWFWAGYNPSLANSTALNTSGGYGFKVDSTYRITPAYNNSATSDGLVIGNPSTFTFEDYIEKVIELDIFQGKMDIIIDSQIVATISGGPTDRVIGAGSGIFHGAFSQLGGTVTTNFARAAFRNLYYRITES